MRPKIFGVTPNYLLGYNDKWIINTISNCQGVASENVYLNDTKIIKELIVSFERHNNNILEILSKINKQ